VRPVLIVKTGETVPGVRARRGDFEDWIAAGLGAGADDLRVVRVDAGEALPDPALHAGVVVTGSSAMVSHREPWSEAAGRWLAGATAAGTPVLGICYGHQLLAHALGGDVAPNPNGREIGTVEVTLAAAAAADPLLGGLPARFAAQVSHVESVLRLPDGAEPLASTRLDPNHAFRAGERAWGIQFHPEFDADVVRGYLLDRREQIAAEGIDVDALLAATVETALAATVLRRFASLLDA